MLRVIHVHFCGNTLDMCRNQAIVHYFLKRDDNCLTVLRLCNLSNEPLGAGLLDS